MLNNEPPASNVNALTADGLVANAVKQDPNAIGYVGLRLAGQGREDAQGQRRPLRAVEDQLEPLKYPLSRYIFIVLPTENPNKAVQKFVDWVRTRRGAGEVIDKAGGVPAFNKKPKK